MKTKTRILFVCIAVLLVTATVLSACGKLDAPQDLKIEGDNFVWSAVEGADGYEIFFNDDESNRFFVWENSLNIFDANIRSYFISGKTNVIWVRAITLDETGEPDVRSKRTGLKFDYMRNLKTPENVVDNGDGTLSWRTVDNATEYYAIVGDDDSVKYPIEFSSGTTGLVGSVSGLKKGTYQLSIIADGNGYVASSPSKSISFNQVVDGKPINVTEGKWNVTFDLNYEGAKSVVVPVDYNTKVTQPKDLSREDYELEGWYMDSHCLIPAGFTEGVSDANITAHTTFYAKWVPAAVQTTPVYYYNVDRWATVYIQYFRGETQLHQGNGVKMTAVSDATGWVTAQIDKRADRVIFTNGTVPVEAEFDLTTPYFKGGEWTAEMPEGGAEDIGVYLEVGTTRYNMEENVDTDKTDGRLYEYIITVELSVGDTVKLTDKDGTVYTHYQTQDCDFNGTATVAGKHTFYLKIYPDSHDIYVVVPVANAYTVYYYSAGWTNVNAYLWIKDSNPEVNNKWPGTAMTAVDGHAGWFSVQVNASIGYDRIIFNNGSDETSTIPLPTGIVEGGSYYYNGAEWTYGFNLYEGPLVTVRTIYLYLPETWTAGDWRTVCAHYWVEGGAGTTWPGTPMTPVAGKAGWYKVDIDLKYQKIIFNNGGQGHQSDTFVIPTSATTLYFSYYGVAASEAAAVAAYGN